MLLNWQISLAAGDDAIRSEKIAELNQSSWRRFNFLSGMNMGHLQRGLANIAQQRR